MSIKEEWKKYHRNLYLPGYAINTNTIYDQFIEPTMRKVRAETLRDVREEIIDLKDAGYEPQTIIEQITIKYIDELL